MLKFFFVCLLLANGALFAYQQGYLESFISNGRDPARASHQLNADKIKLVTANDLATAAASGAASAPEGNADADKKTDLLACTEIGNFNDADAVKFEKQLAALSLGDRLSRRKIDESSKFLVSIPPQGSKEGADKKVSELRRFGVADFTIIKEDGKLQWGISLGIFKTQQEAQTRLSDLAKKGVKSARITPYTAIANNIVFQVRNLDPKTKDSIDKIKAGFPQQDLHNCPAPN